MKITVVGLGYVGLANSLLLAQNNPVIGVDISKEKIDLLDKRESPIRDHEIEEYLKTTTASWTTETSSFKDAELVIVATPTDYDENSNYFDTSSVESVIREVVRQNSNATILIKSTIPIGFTDNMRKELATDNIIFSPEFLREGKALYDNLYPSRIIIGESNERGQKIAELFKECTLNDPPVLNTGSAEAEAIKLFSNAYLALRVAYFNELDTYSIVKGLNTKEVIAGVSYDPRIGDHYNNPSFGYGGYCLPKDTKQLLANFADVPNDIMAAIVKANQTRKNFIAHEILQKHPDIVGVYRLAMKTGSDNYRVSAIQDVIQILQDNGVKVVIYDPSIEAEMFMEAEVVKDFDKFADMSAIIMANRKEKVLEPYSTKVYTRDIFQGDE